MTLNCHMCMLTATLCSRTCQIDYVCCRQDMLQGECHRQATHKVSHHGWQANPGYRTPPCAMLVPTQCPQQHNVEPPPPKVTAQQPKKRSQSPPYKQREQTPGAMTQRSRVRDDCRSEQQEIQKGTIELKGSGCKQNYIRVNTAAPYVSAEST